jgi:signal peptidase I
MRFRWLLAALVVFGASGIAWYRYTDGHIAAPILGWKRWTVRGPAMEPTYHDGDDFWTSPLDDGDKRRLLVGDLVVARLDGSNNMRRIVGIGGDIVEGRDHRLYRNGQALDISPTLVSGALADFPAVVVPDGTVFVIGDNVAAAVDSRTDGPVPFADLVGLVADPRGTR